MFTTLLISGLKRFTQLEFVSLRGGFFPSKEEVYSFLLEVFFFQLDLLEKALIPVLVG